MAPSGSSSATCSRVKTRRKLKPRRFNSVKKKKQNPQKNNTRSSDVEMMMSSSPASLCSNDQYCSQTLEELDISSDHDDDGCSTPKAQRFRLPQVSSCPPPPKKPKSLSICSNLRSSIPFFASPELELFFLGALRDISV
ncbi:cyclin-dependent protein kinase inhibitor SMR13-like [Prosopis cineraria]|uniref:cyclin-dependent protein kinase inhibitor SMR13-like n=1 Tax=Prosopis cineraria TaxID=364024 RepID=UPI00240E9EB8|nr:cyclin-dependent protein kinase inhibitor SMR13-like [Prosopis cineraria]XP_054796116.1 cyclin-dependent protein kinase inhibitor SMR13-like [Prosopis cineraria]XP_054796121.1 cyclin-dependent protein kinase inhibitor SMR13-like [Prosopis cineraria]XP_054796129.1 cyclin-dependent protein kinase inhibitor SMR13-like [Prosopis cineraria]XP_054796134.1 cyclin-dependent protein kinase inhibitor SMR13-like [Prosopis cineraria]